MAKQVSDEREFELINILGAPLGANQRDLSRHMDLSLGMTNMLIRRLIAKGFIRIEQLNKRKVQYILTPKGFAEKMRKSIKYTVKTVNSIGLIKNRIKEILLDLYKNGVRSFHILGKNDLSMLVEMVIKELDVKDCSFHISEEIPLSKVDGLLLICKENVDEASLVTHEYIDLIREIAKNSPEMGVLNQGPLI